MEDWEKFRDRVKRVSNHRNHKIKNSLGVYDAYKYIRKNKWFDIGRPLTEYEFYSIIRTINKYIADEIVKGNDVTLPLRMGRLELRKLIPNISIKNGKVHTSLPIDWDKTLRLWAEDEESYNNKTLIRVEEREAYKVFWNKNKADFGNKSFIEFKVNRDIKLRLKKAIKNKDIKDAFLLYE